MEFYTTFPGNFIEKINIEHQKTFETDRINKFRIVSTLISLDDCIMNIRLDLNSDFLQLFTLSEIIRMIITEWKVHLDSMYYMNVERLLWDTHEEFTTKYVKSSN